jgi:hypothetical protein
MYPTINSALADEHVKNLIARAAADERARQARQARRERRARHNEARHEITARRRPATARHA